MNFFRDILLFIFGSSVGSFLNVLIDRLPKEEQVFKGRSYCDHCRKELAWYDLIPLLSFLLLQGKCRYCGKRISWYYPVVELITGILFMMIFAQANCSVETGTNCYIVTLLHCYIVASFIVIFFTDLKYGIIPDKIVFPAIGLTGLFHLTGISSLANSFTPGSASWRIGVLPWLASGYFGGVLLEGLAAAGFFGLLVLLTKGKGMGLGDVKLAFLMGLLLGFPKIIVALYFAFLTGALVSVILIVGKKKKLGQTIPFGPFLSAATLVAMFWGSEIVGWWMMLFK